MFTRNAANPAAFSSPVTLSLSTSDVERYRRAIRRCFERSDRSSILHAGEDLAELSAELERAAAGAHGEPDLLRAARGKLLWPLMLVATVTVALLLFGCATTSPCASSSSKAAAFALELGGRTVDAINEVEASGCQEVAQ